MRASFGNFFRPTDMVKIRKSEFPGEKFQRLRKICAFERKSAQFNTVLPFLEQKY